MKSLLALTPGVFAAVPWTGNSNVVLPDRVADINNEKVN